MGRAKVSRIAAAPTARDGLIADDVFAIRIATPDARAHNALGWARLVLEKAPGPLALVLAFGWRYLFRFRLDRGNPEAVAGWTPAAPSRSSVALEARSPHLAARNVVVVRDDAVEWVTVVRYDDRRGRWLWALLAPVHRHTLPWLLRRAVRLSR
jgi:hypothetical protein